jgi:ribosomal protein L3
MAGHWGVETVSVQKMKLLKVIPEENLLLIGGGIPGAAGSTVYVTLTNKKVPAPKANKVSKNKVKADAGKAKPAAKK